MRDPPHVSVRSLNHPRPLLVVVEGVHDIEFLTRLSRLLSREDAACPDLADRAATGELVFVPFGGGSPLPWATRLSALGCPEFHLYDRDQPPETELRRTAASLVNERPGCRAFVTCPRALENYLHPSAIERAGGGDLRYGPNNCVASLLTRQWNQRQGGVIAWPCVDRHVRQKKIQRAKRWLNTVAVEHMTLDLLAESDPAGDILRWLRTIADMLAPERPDARGQTSGMALAPVLPGILMSPLHS